jgi:hypothetical protein
MKKHHVDYLDFKFSNDKKKLGYCTTEYISIQTNHALYDDINEIQNTILHEIAHALAGLENNHNIFWKEIAKKIGVKIESKQNQTE